MSVNKTIASVTLIVLSLGISAQNSTVLVDEKKHEYGDLESVYTLKSEFIITNKGQKNLYLLRADAPKDVKILTHKKSIGAGDTTLLEVFFQPSEIGVFSRKISLITSADALPFVLEISGTIKSIKTDDKTACYYFKKNPKTSANPVAVITPPPIKAETPSKTKINKKDSLIKKPIVIDEPIVKTKTHAEPITENENEPLSKLKYKPNNIVFLLDVSGSMRDSSKLPLMKKSILVLLEKVRDIDKISLITYADSVSLKCEAIPGSEKNKLKHIIHSLKPNGSTRGSKAVLFSLDLALKNYIEDGNNQVFLATDGKFPFYEPHYKEWAKKLEGREVVLSVVALGKDRDAIQSLKEIAKTGKGTFIRIKNFEKDKELLLDEIKLRSERK